MNKTDRPTFLDLVNRLTRPTATVVKRDKGDEETEQIGLLQQLRESVFGGVTGGSAASFAPKIPIYADALDLLTEITVQAAQVLAEVSHLPTPYGHAEDYVRLWAGQTREDKMFTVSARATVDDANDPHRDKSKPRVFDELTEYSAYNLLARWVERIETFFNPPGSTEIPAPCPICDTRYVYRMKDGETIRSAALNITRDPDTDISIEARCSACTTTWPRDRFEYLAQIIGAKPVPELATDGAS